MKRMGWLLMAALLLMTAVLPLAASAEGGDLLSAIREKGYITIATEGDWSPWTYVDEATNELTGFDVELGRAIAEKLGVEARFEVAPWDAILAGVSSGRFDLACNGVSYTEERAEAYNFSTPYVYDPSVLVVRADNESIHSFEDLKGKKTANTISSIYAKMAQDYGAEVQGVDALADTIQLVLQGRVDATINASATIEDYLRAQPEAAIRVAAQGPGDVVVLPVRKSAETDTLLAAVNEALEAMRQDGSLSELSIRFFGSDRTNAPE